MSKEKQNNVPIGDKTLPEISYIGNTYYPLSYTIEQILIKKKQPVKKLKDSGYNDYIIKLDVDYTFKGGGLQNTYCISKEGLMKLLNNSNIGGFTVEQKKSMNFLLDYFGMELISEKPRFVDNFNYMNSEEYDEFEKVCITETLKLDNALKWQLCKDCEKYYPLHTNFFRLNSRDKVMETICKNCLMNDRGQHFKHPIYDIKTIDELKNIEKIKSKIPSYDKNYDTIGIYNEYLYSDKIHFPEKIRNKEDYALILKYLNNTGCIDKNKLNLPYLIDDFKLKGVSAYFKMPEVYELLYGNHPKLYPWKYELYNPKQVGINDAIQIFKNYLKDKDITIDSIYDFDYHKHVKSAKLGSKYYSDNLLDFIIKFYDNKYPAYRFKIRSIKYWKEKENRILALKYLIEEDMKLEIEKIPLYLTITSIRSIGTTTMYTVLKNYYSDLYEWVNEVYPDVFDPKDFNINYMRNEFDSIDEQTINDILKDNFENVLYNPKHTEHTITLLGKIPDWFVFTTNGVIIVEYFGLWAKKRGMYNTRTRDYIISSKDKIEKYKTLQGYKFLYIFPEDLDNNYEGLYNKIENIKNNKILNKIG